VPAQGSSRNGNFTVTTEHDQRATMTAEMSGLWQEAKEWEAKASVRAQERIRRAEFNPLIGSMCDGHPDNVGAGATGCLPARAERTGSTAWRGPLRE
jgi:hypothetical protein